MWRWHELLPVQALTAISTLGEGDTPLLPLPTLGKQYKLPSLYIKDESLNPTGSFKARGLSVAISKAKELGIRKVIIPTAGNAGGAMAAYAARAGLSCQIIMPCDTPKSNILESWITGAELTFVEGNISDAAILTRQKADNEGYYDMSTFKEPYRTEGKKIMGYELAEELNWVLPDVIIYPTGGGTGLVAMWKAFLELDELGWLENAKKPRMISVQASGCAPIVKAFVNEELSCEFWANAETIASGLKVPKSFADRLILEYIRKSRGTAVSVSDEEILSAQKQLAIAEGIFASPEGAATLAGLIKLIQSGEVSLDEKVILFNTGSGLKYFDLFTSKLEIELLGKS
jgi:threonine synthase